MTRTRMLALGLTAALAAGCDSAPTDRPEATEPVRLTATPQKGKPDVRTGTAKPDAKKLTFDPTTNTLTVYDPPEGPTQWLVRTDGQKVGVPIARTHTFAAPVSAEAVSVFYAVPNVGTSDPVTLRDILDAHAPPAIH